MKQLHKTDDKIFTVHIIMNRQTGTGGFLTLF